MPVSTCDPANDTGTASTEYLVCHPEGAPFSVRMHRDAVDGIARDILEQGAIKENQPQPAVTAELGGLLLGRVVSGDVWIDRFQRIPCRHHDGPRWALDEEERQTLESSASEILDTGDHSIIGFYRSHIRPDTPLQVDHSDLDLIRRYFADATDLVLLIRPSAFDPASFDLKMDPHSLDLEARFFTRTGSGQTPEVDRRIEPMGPSFAFQGRGINFATAAPPDPIAKPQEKAQPEAIISPPVMAKPAPNVPPAPHSAPDRDPDPEATRQTPRPAPPPAVRHVIVPPETIRNDTRTGGLGTYTESGGRSWWPMFAAVGVVASVAAFLLMPPGWPSTWPNLGQVFKGTASGAAAAALPASGGEPVRPLGLSVNPDGGTWRVSWNPNATALNGARSAQLFVREGDDQKHFDLTPRDLSSGTYEYHSSSNDVTFRLEVAESSGMIAAESFRFRQATAPALAAQTVPATPATQRTAPRPIQRVAPVVGPGIRQRIPGIIPLDIRVTVDAKGRVTSAEPATRSHDSLHKYLSDRAVAAARQWRFEPARVNGQAADGEETIHFVFQK